MADIGAIKADLAGFQGDQKSGLERAFTYLLNNLTFGSGEHQTRTTNMQAYYLQSTTPANANTEFSIAHGLARTPNVLIPVAVLNQVNSQVVPLTVSRAADSQRIYLTSSSTSATFAVLVTA